MPADIHAIIQFRLKRLDDQIRIEYDLIGYRMTWLMTSQSFYFAAFALCATSNKVSFEILVYALLLTLPIIGAASAFGVNKAIRAAHDEIEILKPIRGRVEDEAKELNYEAIGVDKESRIHDAGNWPSRNLPILLVVCWLIALGIVFIELLLLYVRLHGPR